MRSIFILCRWVTQKHCVTPEKVPLPIAEREHVHVASWPPRDPHSYQQQFRANSSNTAHAAHSIAFYDSDIVNSLEKIFNITGQSSFQFTETPTPRMFR